MSTTGTTIDLERVVVLGGPSALSVGVITANAGGGWLVAVARAASRLGTVPPGQGVGPPLRVPGRPGSLSASWSPAHRRPKTRCSRRHDRRHPQPGSPKSGRSGREPVWEARPHYTPKHHPSKRCGAHRAPPQLLHDHGSHGPQEDAEQVSPRTGSNSCGRTAGHPGTRLRRRRNSTMLPPPGHNATSGAHLRVHPSGPAPRRAAPRRGRVQ